MSALRESICKYIVLHAEMAGVQWRESDKSLIEFMRADGSWVPPPDFILKSVMQTVALGAGAAAIAEALKAKHDNP